MTVAQLQQEITALLPNLPELKLAAVSEFVRFLVACEPQTAWLNAQSQSRTYQEWVGPDNDIYDQVFADVAR
jgi:hypothetical protein